MPASSNPFYVSPANPLKALMLGVQGFDSARQRAQEDAIQSGRVRAMEALQAGDAGGLKSALAELIGAGATKDAAVIADYAKNQQSGNNVYGTPIYGTVDGKPAIGTFDRGGQFRKIDTGAFEVTPGVKVIDTGTGNLIVSGKSGQPVGGTAQPGQPSNGPVGYVPKDLTGKERQEAVGKDQAELMKNKTKNEQTLVQLESQWKLVGDTIDKALKNIDWTKAGILGSATSGIPGTPAYDLARVLDTVKANIGFDKLQSMRENSPTGGALGQVSDFENRLLQSVRGAIEQGQSPSQLRANLVRIKQDLAALQNEKRRAFQQTYSGVNPVSSGSNEFRGGSAPQSAPVSKTIGGKTYIQINGQWYEQ